MHKQRQRLVCCEIYVQNVTNFIAHKLVKKLNAKIPYIFSLKTLERTGKGDVAPYFWRPIPIKSISFRGLCPDPLTGSSAHGPCWGFCPQTSELGSYPHVCHVLVTPNL